MSNEITTGKIIKDGLWDNNPIFAQMLGTCPLLATTTSATNGVGMGIATAVVLVASNMVIAMIRNFIPNDVRIPAYIVVIATMVTIIDLTMNAYVHELHKALGIYIPLIVVNCVVLGRAEVFAAKNTVWFSTLDGLFSGLGFTLGLTALGVVREILGSGSIFGFNVVWEGFHPAIAMVLPPGAFLCMGFIMMGVNWINKRRELAAAAA